MTDDPKTGPLIRKDLDKLGGYLDHLKVNKVQIGDFLGDLSRSLLLTGYRMGSLAMLGLQLFMKLRYPNSSVGSMEPHSYLDNGVRSFVSERDD